MTVGLEPRRQDEAEVRARAAGGRRASLHAADFRASVLEHVVHTCAKELRDASALDFYNAFAHTVRDRLVHRWLATQRTHVEQDVKRVCYFSSEFLTGRSLGLCLMNLDLYEAAVELAADYGLDLGHVLECEGDPGLGNGGLGRLAACFMDSLATLELPAIGYGIRYDFGMFEQKIEGGRQVEQHDNWLQLGNPWELPRHEDAQTVRFGGRVVFYQDREGRTRANWVDTRAVIGLPYDSFIVGHRTDTVNTLRLWAARATRDFDLQFFNEGDYRRAVEEKIDTENISKVLYPNDQSEEGKALRLKQQYFFVACSIADIVRRYKLRHTTFDAFPDKFAIQLNDTHPSIAVAELMRVLVDEEGLDWDAAWEITAADVRLHQPHPPARGAGALAGGAVRAPAAAAPADHLRDQPALPAPGADAVAGRQRADRAHVDHRGGTAASRCGWRTWRRSAPTASTASPSCTPTWSRRTCCRDFHELWPERFNNKTNGVTPRRWLLHSNPRLTRLITSAHRLGLDRPAGALAAAGAHARSPTTRTCSTRCTRSSRRTSATWRRWSGGAPASSCRPTRCSSCRSSASTSTSGSCSPACRSSRTTWRSSATPAPTTSPRAYIFAGKAAPGYVMAKLHIRLINDVAAVINADPAVRGRLAMALRAQLRRVAGAGDHPGRRPVGADLDRRQGGLGHQQHEVRAERRADARHARRRQHRDPRRRRPRELLPVRPHRRRGGGHAGRRLRPARATSRAARRWPRRWSSIDSGFFSLGERDRYRPILDGLRNHDPYMVCADFDGYVAAEASAARASTATRATGRAARSSTSRASSRFSSDETIRQYAAEIWGLQPGEDRLCVARRTP